jgi:hypothetical protein
MARESERLRQRRGRDDFFNKSAEMNTKCYTGTSTGKT